jgi:hypothetical protein
LCLADVLLTPRFGQIDLTLALAQICDLRRVQIFDAMRTTDPLFKMH